MVNYLFDSTGCVLLSAEDEKTLSKKIEMGNTNARNRLVAANIRLVIKIAATYINSGLEIEDLIQEGNLGLIHAAQKYNFRKGAKFSTYAQYWIKYYIRNAISKQSKTVSVSERTSRQLGLLEKETVSLQQKLKRMPTVKEIADKLNWGAKKIEVLSRVTRKEASLEAEVSDGNITLAELLSDKLILNPITQYEKKSINRNLKIAVNRLPTREKYVIEHTYGLNDAEKMSYTEIGDVLGLTRQRISQIEQGAIKMLRYGINSKFIEAYAA